MVCTTLPLSMWLVRLVRPNIFSRGAVQSSPLLQTAHSKSSSAQALHPIWAKSVSHRRRAPDAFVNIVIHHPLRPGGGRLSRDKSKRAGPMEIKGGGDTKRHGGRPRSRVSNLPRQTHPAERPLPPNRRELRVVAPNLRSTGGRPAAGQRHRRVRSTQPTTQNSLLQPHLDLTSSAPLLRFPLLLFPLSESQPMSRDSPTAPAAEEKPLGR